MPRKRQIPVIFLSFANSQVEGHYLRQLKAEKEAILHQLQKAEMKGLCEIKDEYGVSLTNLKTIFNNSYYKGRISIFHFGGHSSPDFLKILSEDGGNTKVNIQYLAKLLGGQRNLKLVFLNGCNNSKYAELFLDNEIPVVISTVKPIADELATEFAKFFYQNIASGDSIKKAFDDTKNYIKHHYANDLNTYRDSEPDYEASRDKFPWNITFNDKQVAENWRLEAPTKKGNVIFYFLCSLVFFTMLWLAFFKFYPVDNYSEPNTLFEASSEEYLQDFTQQIESQIETIGIDSSISLLNTALNNSQNLFHKSIIYESMGDILCQGGYFEEALQKYDSVKIDPDNKEHFAEIHFKRGTCFYKSGDTLQAVIAFKLAIAQGHKKAENYHNKINPIHRRIIGYKNKCCDGTISEAKGKGACSHHGGVCGQVAIYNYYRKY